MLPTRLTQGLQVFMQDRVISRTLGSDKPIAAPWLLRLFNHVALLPRIPARIVGLGFRPEHVQTPAIVQPVARPVENQVAQS